MSDDALEIPRRMKLLPVDPQKKMPVPWFVQWIDGKPEFRIMDRRKRVLAVNENLCWVCGQPLGARFVFVVGPMCAVNRISSEPPSHRECAEYSARACPFLTMPKMIRREAGLPEDYVELPGMITRNPGIALLWVTKDYRVVRAQDNFLIQMGEPLETLWLTEGRRATREEVLHSIETGCPVLQEAARAQGPKAVERLQESVKECMRLVPVAWREGKAMELSEIKRQADQIVTEARKDEGEPGPGSKQETPGVGIEELKGGS